jgi:hypothetical protein
MRKIFVKNKNAIRHQDLARQISYTSRDAIAFAKRSMIGYGNIASPSPQFPPPSDIHNLTGGFILKFSIIHSFFSMPCLAKGLKILSILIGPTTTCQF